MLVEDAQVALRRQRRLQTALRTSRLPGVKALDSFDFAFQPSIDRTQILSLHQLGFLDRKENVIFLGPRGAERGRRVYYGTLADLVLSLVEAERQGTPKERLANPDNAFRAGSASPIPDRHLRRPGRLGRPPIYGRTREQIDELKDKQ